MINGIHMDAEVSETTPIVRLYKHCVTNDGKISIVIGNYTAISKPMKGIAQVNKKKYAAIVMTDGTHVFLEPMNSAQATRLSVEIEEFNGKWVHVLGTINLIMPSSGQSLINPCISPVISIHRHEQEDTNQ